MVLLACFELLSSCLDSTQQLLQPVQAHTTARLVHAKCNILAWNLVLVGCPLKVRSYLPRSPSLSKTGYRRCTAWPRAASRGAGLWRPWRSREWTRSYTGSTSSCQVRIYTVSIIDQHIMVLIVLSVEDSLAPSPSSCPPPRASTCPPSSRPLCQVPPCDVDVVFIQSPPPWQAPPGPTW